MEVEKARPSSNFYCGGFLHLFSPHPNNAPFCTPSFLFFFLQRIYSSSSDLKIREPLRISLNQRKAQRKHNGSSANQSLSLSLPFSLLLPPLWQHQGDSRRRLPEQGEGERRKERERGIFVMYKFFFFKRWLCSANLVGEFRISQKLNKTRRSSAIAMAAKIFTTLLPWLFLLSITLLFLYTSFLPIYSPKSPKGPKPSFPKPHHHHTSPPCNFTRGRWIQDPHHTPIYDGSCPFHRNAWNCLRNKRENMETINSWKWVPENCDSPRIDPVQFLGSMRNRRIGFVGDSLNENFLVSFLCILRAADGGASKWKRKGAWRGGYFPKFNVTVAYHRAVLLARYGPSKHLDIIDQDGLKGTYRVDVDIPADDWINATKFYDVLIFNTGHWWGLDKFPKEKPLVFYLEGKPISPPLGILDGLQVVLKNMVSFIEREVPRSTLKFWRTQSPRHFYGGDWNQNGSCLFDMPLKEDQLDAWFDPNNKGVNKEARKVNHIIEQALHNTDIQLLDLTHLSEFRADAHPAVWLGRKDAVAIWGQDCMHWCLPGVPDTWVDILSAQILYNLRTR